MSPEEVPPPESFSWRPRRALKLEPVPEPYLKSRASFFTSSKMDMRSSLADWMKQAEHCGASYALAVSATVPCASLHAQLPPLPSMPYR
jgi:hypothetical protein